MSGGRWSRGSSPYARLSLVPCLLALLGCSSAAEPPATEECKADAECPEGFVCAIDQGRCLPGNEAAPRAHLGFDVRERAAGEIRFRVEVDGCDCAIEEAENIRELSLRRGRVSQVLQLGASTTDDPTVPLPTRFEITQPSRFGQVPSPQRSLTSYPPTEAEPTEELPTSPVRWSRYHLLDPKPPRELILWSIEPDSELNLGLRYQGLRPPRTDADKTCELDTDCCEPLGDCDPFPNYCDPGSGQCTAIGSPEWIYKYPYQPACSRGFEGDVVTFDPTAEIGQQQTPLLGASVRVRYADTTTERFGIPAFSEIPLSERPPQCSDDSECDPLDEFCDPVSQQCFLSLSGLPADKGSNAENGTFRTYVYTYCDDEPTGSQQRRFGVTITPPSPQPDMPVPAPQPSVDVLVDANFFPGPGGSVLRVGERFCVPDWGEPVSLELEASGQPRTLTTGAGPDQGYTCCDLGCLPATAEDLEMAAGPPPAAEACDVRTSSGATASVQVTSYFVFGLQDEDAWMQADCAQPVTDELDRAGALERLADCSTPDAPCRVDGVARGTAEQPRRYEVRVESPVGSVLASGDFVLQLDDQEPPLQSLTLAPRVLVTGVVDVDSTICARRDPSEDCAAREAVVIAERLRLPGELTTPPPGPYLHSVSTFYDPVAQRDGAFVLPLDPGGVYVVTALPTAGAEGGPASFAVLDLRTSAAEPLAPLRLVLEDGVVVTLNLENFDQRTSVVPVDRGSYLVEGNRLLHPSPLDPAEDGFVDLNRIGECWTPEDEGPQGCKIRRLIPPGSDLARSQVGLVRFTARRSDQAECPLRCPLPRSEP
ncbi:MAG: hypothetical protein AB1Z98_38580 [Nannocystaceae bacterium]